MLAIPVHTCEKWNQGVSPQTIAINAMLTSLVSVAAAGTLFIDKNLYSLPQPHWIIATVVLLASDVSLVGCAIRYSNPKNQKTGKWKTGLLLTSALMIQGIALSRISYFRNFFIKSNARILTLGMLSVISTISTCYASKKVRK